MNQNKGALVIICVLGLVVGIGLSYFLNPNNKLVDDLNNQIKDLESKNQTLEKEVSKINEDLSKRDKLIENLRKFQENWLAFKEEYGILQKIDATKSFGRLEKINTWLVVQNVKQFSGVNYVFCATQGTEPMIVVCTRKEPLSDVNVGDVIDVYLTYVDNVDGNSVFNIDYYEKL